MKTTFAFPLYAFSNFSMMGAIILQGTHFFAPRSSMVTMPFSGIFEKSPAKAPGVKKNRKASIPMNNTVLFNGITIVSFFLKCYLTTRLTIVLAEPARKN